LVCAVAVTVLAACSASGGRRVSQSPSGSSVTAGPLGALAAASRAEKGLTIYGNAPVQFWVSVVAAFNKQYPWIKVDAIDVDDTVLFSRYAAEHATGTRTADILVASAPNLWAQAVQKGVLRQFTVPTLSRFPDFTNQGQGLFVMSPDPAITIYNKQLIKAADVPHTIAAIGGDVTAGKYRAAVFSVDNTFGYSGFWGYVHEKGWTSLSQIAPKARISEDGGAMAQTVAQGAAAVGVFESGLVRGALAQLQDVVGWEYAKDFTPLIPRGIGVTAGAASPNSAQLFVDFLFSHVGQQALCSAGFTASENGFSSPDNCANSLSAIYAAVGRANTHLVPISTQLATDQKAFNAHWHQTFTGR
jgi:iron(III) transport system substrate-binding protein